MIFQRQHMVIRQIMALEIYKCYPFILYKCVRTTWNPTRLDKHIYGLFANIMLQSLSDSRQAMTKSTTSEPFAL